MKLILISLLIACALVAILNFFRPIENIVNASFLTVAITTFIYVYYTLWQTRKKSRK